MLVATLLLVTAISPSPQAIVTEPGQHVELRVIGRDSSPIQGVTITLLRVTQHEDEPHLLMLATNESGEATIETPKPGEYILRFALPGFLTTTLGPFKVCSSDQVACGPSLVTPTTVMLPEAAFVD